MNIDKEIYRVTALYHIRLLMALAKELPELDKSYLEELETAVTGETE